MSVTLARGSVVEALRRYDPGLRVRRSWEGKISKIGKHLPWCVDAPVKIRDPRMFVPPVWYERIGNSDDYVEHILPENSDRYISYHDKRYIICYSAKVDWFLYKAIVKRDGHRMPGGFVQEFNRNLRARNDAKFKERENSSKELAYAAYDKYQFLNRKYPWLDPVTAGISMQGWKEPVASYERKENV